MAPILAVKDLTHIYSIGTPFEHAAIAHIDFSIEQGEFIGLIGHTGSGKSTLIQHLNGLLKPSSGQILFHGADIWQTTAQIRRTRFQIGLVFQYPEYQLFEETVYKDIAFGPKNMGLPEAEIRQRVLRAIGFVGLPEQILEKSPFELSGGQKRRVAIAGVIAMEPEILILDEPTAGLDPVGQRQILENIRAYQQAQNATIMMVTHSMEDVAVIADRLLVMNDGQIAMQGTPAEIFTHAAELTAMGLNVPQVTQVILALREKGLALPSNLFTVEQALQALIACKGGHHA